MASTEPSDDQVDEALELDVAKASRRLRHGLISLGILVGLVIGLLLAVPGLHDVAHIVAEMPPGLIALAIVLEILSCASYVIAFLQVFDRAPIRFGARVALSELAFGAAVSLGGAGSVAVGALLLVERGATPGVVVRRSAVLFLLTSAVNLITLALAGFGVWFGILPDDRDPLLSLVPGAVGVVVFLAFLALPWATDRLVPEDRRGPIAVVLRTTAETVRATEQVLFTRDWRLIGAFGFLWFDIGVLVVCFWATGHTPPLATIVLAYQIGYLSNFLPIPGGSRRTGRKLRGDVRALRGSRNGGGVRHDRLPRDLAMGAGDMGDGRISASATDPRSTAHAASSSPRTARPRDAQVGRAVNDILDSGGNFEPVTGLSPIHLVRYGLPGAILLAGVLVIVVGSDAIATAAGVVLIGVSFMVYLVDVLARLAITSQDDRDREQRARARFARTGRWDEPPKSVECKPGGRPAGRSERPRRARQRSQHQDHSPSPAMIAQPGWVAAANAGPNCSDAPARHRPARAEREPDLPRGRRDRCRHPGQQQRRDRHEDPREHLRPTRSATADDPTRQRREQEHHHRHRQRVEAGVQRGVAADNLQVQRALGWRRAMLWITVREEDRDGRRDASA